MALLPSHVCAVVLAWTSLLLSLAPCSAFSISSLRSPTFSISSSTTTTALSASSSDCLVPGDRVLLIGPGFLQLNVAKAAKAAGLIPMIVAPQKKLDTFSQFVNDGSIMVEADIGLPDDPSKAASGVVFCSEEAVFGESIVNTVFQSSQSFVNGDEIKRVMACVPISNTVNKEKGMGWMPVFNNDKNERKLWEEFINAFQSHPLTDSNGTLIRYGNLLGGSVDGPQALETLGLDECVYKMSLENYRDLKERSFDRFRLGAQILEGDTVNVRPPNLDKMEKEAIQKAEILEAYRITGGYPEVDYVCRHVAAQAIVQTLMRPQKDVPKEFTVLSKCDADLPTPEQWNELFRNPGAASWPDPFEFDPSTLPQEV